MNRRTVLATLVLAALIPMTMAVGLRFPDSRVHTVIGLLIVLYTLVPFFALFEKRRPQAREIVVIAVLCALAVVGRLAFFMLSQFKPMAAVVVISGICFGPQCGFLVGAVSAFVSNFFFGQGPFTPWQMLGFGLVGFLAGLLFAEGRLPRKRLFICLYGGIAVFAVYGAVVNVGSLFTAIGPAPAGGVLAVFLAALPFDAMHAGATVAFLWLLSGLMIEKLERIKIKYGLMEPTERS